jgi:AbrB family looped-hinge helix DNA binding protein
MKEILTRVTRKGQITLPVEIRRALGIREGDKVAVSLIGVPHSEETQAVVRPVRSVAEMTFGAVRPRKRPEDFKELRQAFEEGVAEQVIGETQSETPPIRQ